jgi:phospholipid transport system substrate-binding protein
MTLSRRSLLSALLALPIAGVATGQAFAGSPQEDYVHQLGLDVLRMAQGGHRGDKALQRRFAGLLNRYISISGIASFALGSYKAKIPDGDKSMFYGLVSNYAAALFVFYVDDFQGSDLKINSSSQQGQFTVVDTTIVGKSEQLRWRVSGSPGSFRIADLNVKGIWLSLAMQKMFKDTLNSSQGNFDPLYAKLREANTWQ